MKIRREVLAALVDEGTVRSGLFNPSHGIAGVAYTGTYDPDPAYGLSGTVIEEGPGVYAYRSRVPDPYLPTSRCAIFRVTIAALAPNIRSQVVEEADQPGAT